MARFIILYHEQQLTEDSKYIEAFDTIEEVKATQYYKTIESMSHGSQLIMMFDIVMKTSGFAPLEDCYWVYDTKSCKDSHKSTIRKIKLKSLLD